VRTVDLGIDVRHPLIDAQVSGIASWRIRTRQDTAIAVTRAEAKRLATGILRRTRELTDNQRALPTHVNSLAKAYRTSAARPGHRRHHPYRILPPRPGAVRGGFRRTCLHAGDR
jgi:hypothetical protein